MRGGLSCPEGVSPEVRRVPRIVLAGGLAALYLALVAAAGPDSTERQSRRQRLALCREWLRAARGYEAAGRADSALMVLDSVLWCDSANADGYYFKARILAHRGDTTAAADVLDTGIGRVPLSSRLKLFRARLYLAQGRPREAMELAQRILMVKRRDPETLYLLGLAQLEQGDTTAALESFEKAAAVTLEKKGL